MSFLKAILVCQLLVCLGITQTYAWSPLEAAGAVVGTLIRLPFRIVGCLARIVVNIITCILRTGARLLSSLIRVRARRSLPDVPAIAAATKPEYIAPVQLLAKAAQYTA